MSQEVARREEPTLAHQIMESVLMVGDLAKLDPQGRLSYYKSVCESLKLNPLTRPFEYVSLNGKLTLYATKNCTEQLRYRDGISVVIVSREVIDGVYVVIAKAYTPPGRCDESSGAVSVESLKGEAKANAFMKAETKAKRRVTLSICGLGILDESEIEYVRGARMVRVDNSGQIAETAEEKDAADVDTGGHQVGTQSAANYVAEQKISEMKSKKSPKGKFDILAEFAKMKAAIGEKNYYLLLRQYGGVNKSNEFTQSEESIAKARAAYGHMLALKKQLNEEPPAAIGCLEFADWDAAESCLGDPFVRVAGKLYQWDEGTGNYVAVQSLGVSAADIEGGQS